jgi:hypothetical protein
MGCCALYRKWSAVCGGCVKLGARQRIAALLLRLRLAILKFVAENRYDKFKLGVTYDPVRLLGARHRCQLDSETSVLG